MIVSPNDTRASVGWSPAIARTDPGTVTVTPALAPNTESNTGPSVVSGDVQVSQCDSAAP